MISVCLLLAVCIAASQAETGNGRAVLLQVNGVVGPATVDYLQRGFSEARDQGAALIILEMDTPGGLDAAMREIIRGIIQSPIPVATYVTPGGARAASAGTYILYASHVAAMAPGTNLGAATPVQIGGGGAPNPGDDQPGGSDNNDNGEEGSEGDGEAADEQQAPQPETAMERKMVNDAVAYIRSLAEMRGRNADWAEKAVRQAASLAAREALAMNVVDYVVDDLDELLAHMHGREVRVATGDITLNTEGLEIRRLDPDWRNELLEIITNPNIAYILMLVGIYGLIFELANPGGIVPGVIGGICLLVALFAFQALPINYAGAGLMVLGIAFMIAEAFVPSFGILGIGGLIAFALGSLLLVDTGVEAYEISLSLVIGVSLVSFAVFFGIATMALRSYRKAVTSGREQLMHSTAVAEADFIGGTGKVRLMGERWNADSTAPIHKGDPVRVTGKSGLRLQVAPLETRNNQS